MVGENSLAKNPPALSQPVGKELLIKQHKKDRNKYRMGHLSIRKKKTGRARHSGDGPTFSHETILSDNSRTPEKKKKKKHDTYSLGHESQKSPRITKENGFKNQNDPEKFLAS
jgi:hypothetical protein